MALRGSELRGLEGHRARGVLGKLKKSSVLKPEGKDDHVKKRKGTKRNGRRWTGGEGDGCASNDGPVGGC